MLLLATKEKPLWLSPIILLLFALFSVLGTDQVAQLTLESTVTQWVLPLQSLEQWSSSARASQAAGKVSSTFLKVLAITSLHFSVFWALFLSVYFWGGVSGCRSDADCAWTHITHSQVPWCANFSLPIDAQLPAAGDYCLGTLLASRSAPCAYNRSSSCFLYFLFSHCVWVEASNSAAVGGIDTPASTVAFMIAYHSVFRTEKACLYQCTWLLHFWTLHPFLSLGRTSLRLLCFLVFVFSSRGQCWLFVNLPVWAA